MKSVEQLFESELRGRRVAFSRDPETGLYRIESGGGTMTVSLDNLRRDLARDGDAGMVPRFVEKVLSDFDLPPWEVARSQVFFSAQPSEQPFGDTLRESVTETVCKVLVFCDEDEGKITWLTPDMLTDWGVEREAVEAAALENLDGLLRGLTLEIEDIDGTRLGMVPVSSVFKASLIFAPGFQALVSQMLGWPVLVVIPCRDFLYVLAEKDVEFLGRLGGTVQSEYRQSGYPITTEVIRVSDEGVRAIGKFPE
jgi:hypothetical protein